jgi:hypothetical protein
LGLEHAAIAQRIEDAGEATGEGDHDHLFAAARGDAQGLSALYRRAGRREQAREHLTIATTMYYEVEMPFWLEKAKADAEEFA